MTIDPVTGASLAPPATQVEERRVATDTPRKRAIKDAAPSASSECCSRFVSRFLSDHGPRACLIRGGANPKVTLE